MSRYSHLIYLKINDNFIGEAYFPDERNEYHLMLIQPLSISEMMNESFNPKQSGWKMTFEWRGKFKNKKLKQRLFEFKEIS